MQSCHCFWGGGTFVIINFGVWAFGVCWGFKFSNAVGPKTLENCPDVDLLGDLQDAFLGVAINARFQRPLDLPVIGDDHIFTEFVKNHLPGFLTLGVAQHKKVIDMSTN